MSETEAVERADEAGASEREAEPSDDEEQARVRRVVRFGRLTESITLGTGHTAGCDAAADAGPTCAIVCHLRSGLSANTAVQACLMMSFVSLIVCKDRNFLVWI